MKKHSGLCILVICVSLVGAGGIFAQDLKFADEALNPPPKGKTFWLNFGFGLGSSLGDASATISSFRTLTYQFGDKLVSLRVGGCGEFMGHASMMDVGILYGRAKTRRRSLVAGGIGIGYVEGYGGKKDISTIGIPLEFQLFFRPASFLGIGLYNFANINFGRPFFGTSLCLQIGKLR